MKGIRIDKLLQQSNHMYKRSNSSTFKINNGGGVYMRIGSFEGMKSLNRSIVLNKIRIDAPISRAHIARDTKLTPPTVSKIVNELLDDQLIIESEIGQSMGGRKPTMLTINEQQFHVIGLDIGSRYIRLMLCNLTGKVIEKSEKVIPSPLTNEKLIAFLIEGIHQLTNANKEKEIVGIGIGMHGAVDVQNGIALYAPLMDLHNIPLKAALEKQFDIPVIVDNDVRALAFGEYWFGQYEEANSIVAINLGYGVGAGIVVDGKLFHGENDIAGEIGHMIVDLSGNQCSCGNVGCWQTLVSGPAIVERAEKQLDTHKQLSAKKVYELACEGNQIATKVLTDTGRYIGVGITNLIHLFNPSTIILAGGVTGAKDFFLPEMQKTISKLALTDKAKLTKVHVSNNGHFGTAFGAASFVLAQIFLND